MTKNTQSRILDESTARSLITNETAGLPLSQIIALVQQSHFSAKRRSLTSLCEILAPRLGITDVMQSDEKWIIKAVMTQLRLRVCVEACTLGLLKIGDQVVFSAKRKILRGIGATGMLIVPSGDDVTGKVTYVDPIGNRLLWEAIKQTQQ